RSSSRPRAIRLAPAWSPRSRGRAAMSRGCRARQPKLPQAPRTFARNRSRSRPVGDHGQGNPLSVLELGEVKGAARALGLEVHTLEIRRAEDISPAFDALKGRADALYVCPDPLVNTHRIRINTLALGARLPTIHGLREYVEASRLMSYGANAPDLFR